MAVRIDGITKKSHAEALGIEPGDILVSINGHEIVDGLDYRFYETESHLDLVMLDEKGRRHEFKLRKGRYEPIGFEFNSYLIDEQRSCRNKCIFCFIDQLPHGMRDTLYFKDDDSRLSFLFGNYITLTNLTEHEIERIIKMHISPVNISVHTTNPELRCRMMNNRFAGEKLEIIQRLDDAGIKMNFQLVLVPGYNDGDELEKSLRDLSSYKNAQCIASVPVGLTKYREGLTEITPFGAETSKKVIEITEKVNKECEERLGVKLCFAADEFYLKAGLPIPSAEHYGDFHQLDNGVGMWSLFEKEAADALDDMEEPICEKRICCATGVAAYPLIKATVDKAGNKWHNLKCNVYEIRNDFFGERITVAGLLTGGDIIAQLKGKDIGDILLIPSNMLRFERDLFLDSVSVAEVEKELEVEIKIIEPDGYSFVEALAGF